jgi:hypothetical protein
MSHSLTGAQWRKMEEFRDECLAFGRSCEPSDRKAAENVWRKFAAVVNRRLDGVLWVDGPATGMLAATLFSSALRSSPGSTLESSLWSSSPLCSTLESTLESSLGPSLGSSLGSSLWSSLGSSLESSLWSSLRSSERSSLRWSLESSLRSSFRSSLESSLRASLESSLESSLGLALGLSLGASLESSLESLWSSLGLSLFGSSLWSYFWTGQHGSSWWWHKYFCGLIGECYVPQAAELLSLWCTLGRSTGWWLVWRDMIIACERPRRQAVDAEGRLHHESGPALLCRDGWPVYAWHGVLIPDYVFERPETISLDMIRRTDSEEIRQVMIERLGWERFLRASGANSRHRRFNERDHQWEQLYQLRDGSQQILVSDPSTGRKYALGVPREIENCEQAQRWMSHGLDRLAIHRS